MKIQHNEKHMHPLPGAEAPKSSNPQTSVTPDNATGSGLHDAACCDLPIPVGAVARLSLVTEVFEQDGRSRVESIVSAWYSHEGSPLSAEAACRLVDERTEALVGRQAVYPLHRSRQDTTEWGMSLGQEYSPPMSLLPKDVAFLEKFRQTDPSVCGVLVRSGCGGSQPV
jgi:hypothetical protein